MISPGQYTYRITNQNITLQKNCTFDKTMVKVAFIHPDLGIGGAERLVVDAAIALKNKGHEVSIITAHHDPNHCFEETRNGDLSVCCVGDWLPRRIFGKFYAFCATIRMIYASLYLTLFSGICPEIIICDQISNSLPILKSFSSAKIIFYCHFPDQLLTDRKTAMKKLYRKVMDYLEEKTLKFADLILVNSKFTRNVVQNTFKSLDHIDPQILYPSLNTTAFDEWMKKVGQSGSDNCKSFTCLSINRYERKKNIALAIEAFDLLAKSTSDENVKLIIAGGYDNRVDENVQYFNELVNLAEDLGISTKVEFLKSPSDEEKVRLLLTSNCLMYTPSGEHFGIVPIEAMYHELPVIAVNDGGPTETVVHGETGFLCSPKSEEFAEALRKLKEGGQENKAKLGANGRNRVLQSFSFNSFATRLDDFVNQTLSD